jgi:hypothetical protein
MQERDAKVHPQHYPNGPYRIWIHWGHLLNPEPLRWKKPKRIFVNDLSDTFHDAVPVEVTERALHIFRQGSQHTWLLLTKRIERARTFFETHEAGSDWRPIADEAFDEAKVVSSEEGAFRVPSELQTFLAGKVFTLKEYSPEFFSLGYFSMPKRRGQTVMQPVYVAMFRPVGPFPSTGRLVVVPAGANIYESIARSVVTPPASSSRPAPKATIS